MPNETLALTDRLDELAFNRVLDIILHYVMPVLTFFGFFGNIITVFILSRREVRTVNVTPVMRVNNRFLLALSASDALICLMVFPSMFIHGPVCNFLVAGYSLYGSAVINWFLLASTWLRLAIAVERTLALFFPLRMKMILARGLGRVYKTIAFVYFFSFVITFPLLWHFQLSPAHASAFINSTTASGPAIDIGQIASCTLDDNRCCNIRETVLFGSQTLHLVHHYMLAVVGNYAPLVILVISAVSMFYLFAHLNRELSISRQFGAPSITPRRRTINRARKSKRHHLFFDNSDDNQPQAIEINNGLLQVPNEQTVVHSSASSANHHEHERHHKKVIRNHAVIVLCLVVVLEFLILVAPSETVKVIVAAKYGPRSKEFVMAETLFNITQIISYALNFVIYFHLYPKFRVIFLSRLPRCSTPPATAFRGGGTTALHTRYHAALKPSQTVLISRARSQSHRVDAAASVVGAGAARVAVPLIVENTAVARGDGEPV